MSEHGIEALRENMKKCHSPEANAKRSITLTGRKLTKQHIRNSMRRRVPTSLECKLLNLINEAGLPYRFVGDGSFIIEHMNPDFINTNGAKIAVEVYAKFFKSLHGGISTWKANRSRKFSKYGWHVVYFDETQLTIENVLRKLGGDSN
jgi:hypothetical protein